ncbi:AMP-binding enzyme [Stachybotrys elegans]|uniref:AMP-binding enzyme n=1 Tax=Stachybotrys elegans TaxID=80388 RepID=A0A8K0SHD3_9HYPO|nr:AMP-binding enzyme [Stachybotrys elegans]
MFGPKGTPLFRTATEAFFHHAAASPDTLAAVDLKSPESPKTITYGELCARVAVCGQRLRQLGVLPGMRVPVVVKRGIDMLVGILSVLSCGAQYVPLDGGVVPDSTLRFVVEQTSGSRGVVVAMKATKHRLQEWESLQVIEIDAIDSTEAQAASVVPVDLAEPNHGCYIIYTSGTTGTPKGVDVTHANVVNLVLQSPGNLGITTGSRVGQVLNISFDMAAWEMLGCLCNGGTLVLRGSDWEAALKEIDVLICTPSILAKYQPKDFPKIKVVATAGEPSAQKLADAWATDKTYYNCCGPTETTIVNTMHDHVPGQPLSIGKPTPNNNVYILDEDMRAVAPGEPGVMWAGGLGVTRGYIGLPEKTAEKYKPDTFVGNGSFMYNTGDLGRWNSDGSIDILGRCDDQVKIKGFRVELDGVTSSLRACAGVATAAVLLHQGEIHAFVAPATCDVAAIKTHMKLCQPYYAVPSHFHLMDSLPLTANGKTDKKTLRTTIRRASDTASETTDTDLKSAVSSAVTQHSTSSSSSLAVSEEKVEAQRKAIDLEAALPEKDLVKYKRNIRHRVLIVYRRLFSLVALINIGAALAVIFSGFPRVWVGNITAINLVVAVLLRQELVINAFYWLTCSVPTSWPLFIRKHCARIFHLGGVHSGAAVSSALWLLANNIGDVTCMVTDTCSGGWGSQSIPARVVSWVIAAGFVVMLSIAYPTVRKARHDLFEKTHRFLGWTMLGLFWVQTVLTANDTKGEMTLGQACLRSPPLWLLVVATCSIIFPWLFLRKVKVDSEVLSNHAIRLHFNYTVPVNGSFTRISRSPLLEWHSFATVPAPTAVNGREKGYSLVVSNAGDWTRETIKNPPTELWVRGLPTCGVMRIATLFRRVVVVATGSGIGPVLGHIQDHNIPTQLIWSTPNPQQTFGEDLCNTIRQKIPDAIIWDTKQLGRPDLAKMSYNLAKGFDAEAVIIIANEKITKKVVYGLETRGVPAYGAIWDS